MVQLPRIQYSLIYTPIVSPTYYPAYLVLFTSTWWGYQLSNGQKKVWNNPEISKVKVISLQFPQFLFGQKKLGWNDNSTYSSEATPPNSRMHLIVRHQQGWHGSHF